MRSFQLSVTNSVLLSVPLLFTLNMFFFSLRNLFSKLLRSEYLRERHNLEYLGGKSNWLSYYRWKLSGQFVLGLVSCHAVHSVGRNTDYFRNGWQGHSEHLLSAL